MLSTWVFSSIHVSYIFFGIHTNRHTFVRDFGFLGSKCKCTARRWMAKGSSTRTPVRGGISGYCWNCPKRIGAQINKYQYIPILSWGFLMIITV